ncbi:MAG: hypothetical protein HOQ24_12475 [Mycobacteriaceae bacterium]|nr:hypothetical protein [Mycobacteriaceae bacterium]
MVYNLNADPATIQAAAKKAMGLQGEHEGYMKATLGIKDELEAYVKSPGAGQAIANAMFDAHTAGSKLAQTLQTVINVLSDAGTSIDTHDMELAAQVNRATAFGLDGKASVDSFAGSAGHAATGKIDTAF